MMLQTQSSLSTQARKSQPMPSQPRQPVSLLSRRQWLARHATGFGQVALAGMLAGSSPASSVANAALQPAPHFKPRARHVIFLFMDGGMSQVDTFDPKPRLADFDGKPFPMKTAPTQFNNNGNTLASPWKFRQYGESGLWVSDLFPHVAGVADELCVIRSMTSEFSEHTNANYLLHTGAGIPGRPSMGAWCAYGLGDENENLPGFVVLTSGGQNPDAGKAAWGSGFLPSVYQGVHCRSHGEPVLFLDNPPGIDRDLRRASVEAIQQANQDTYREFQDPETLSRISQYEMAFRMQISAPGVMDISDEPEYIRDLYGARPGEGSFANNVLLARKLVEKGVRFVQLFDWGWDVHGNSPDTALEIGLVNKCRQVDKAITALILDLKQRGLLEETLVVWGSEFGRTPMQENRNGLAMPYKGRDHHADAFTVWMCGGGIKQGVSYGETDEIGFYPVSGKVSVYDVQATILNRLGFDHERFTYPFQGRQFRLTDVSGQVIEPVIA